MPCVQDCMVAVLAAVAAALQCCASSLSVQYWGDQNLQLGD